MYAPHNDEVCIHGAHNGDDNKFPLVEIHRAEVVHPKGTCTGVPFSIHVFLMFLNDVQKLRSLLFRYQNHVSDVRVVQVQRAGILKMECRQR
jgi:hypothetical protein